jgi:hypothetical protein
MSKALHPTCNYHTTGVPPWAKGKNWRVPNCSFCDAKVARGEVTEDAPLPEEVFRQWRAEGRKKDQRYEVTKRRKAARAAMTKQFRENLPGRECA